MHPANCIHPVTQLHLNQLVIDTAAAPDFKDRQMGCCCASKPKSTPSHCLLARNVYQPLCETVFVRVHQQPKNASPETNAPQHLRNLVVVKRYG